MPKQDIDEVRKLVEAGRALLQEINDRLDRIEQRHSLVQSQAKDHLGRMVDIRKDVSPSETAGSPEHGS